MTRCKVVLKSRRDRAAGMLRPYPVALDCLCPTDSTMVFRSAIIELPMGIRTAYPQGAQVEHLKFGLGTVLSSNEEHIVIKFDDFGEKKFVTTIVLNALKKSDRQPPVEKRSSRSRKPKAVTAVANQ